MIGKEFFVSPSWLNEFYTKYPHGLSVMENLIEWATTAEQMRLYLQEIYQQSVPEDLIYGAKFKRYENEITDDGIFSRMIDMAGSGGVIHLIPGKTYELSETFELPSYLKIIGNFAKINYRGNNQAMFHTLNKEEINIENLYIRDFNGTNTFFHAEGARSGAGVTYTKRLRFTNVHAADFNKAFVGNYFRQAKFDHCMFYCKNGIEILNKSVEINITDTIIFGSVSPYAGNFGVKLDCSSGETIDYPEGVMISGCTIDNYYHSVRCNNVFVLQITNSFIAVSDGTGEASLYFGKGMATHNQDITISNCVIYRKGIIFTPETPSDFLYKTTISNCRFEAVLGIFVLLNKRAAHINVSNCSFMSAGDGVGIVCNDVNKHCTFTNIRMNTGFISGIQVKGSLSDYLCISNLFYEGTADAIYFEQLIYLNMIVAPNATQKPYFTGTTTPV